MKSDSNNSIITFRECPRCNTKNEPNAILCKLCGLILDARYANKREDKIKVLESRIDKLAEMFNELINKKLV